MDPYSIEIPTFGKVNQDIVQFMFQNLLNNNSIDKDIQRIYYIQFF